MVISHFTCRYRPMEPVDDRLVVKLHDIAKNDPKAGYWKAWAYL